MKMSEHPMKRLPWFIVVGVLFSVPGEILNQILARHNVAAFRSTMLSYVVLLFIAFFTAKAIQRIVRRRDYAVICYYLLFGTLGLMVEWFLLGNAPVADPFQVVTQPGMFTFWGTLVLAPMLLQEPAAFVDLQRSFLRFFVSFSLLYLIVAAVVPRSHGGIYFGFILFAAGTASLNYFYVKYFRRLTEIHRHATV